ncbi:hypothetical protein [Enterovirga sp.]|uniref:hypothetical protein n=1 Tax=Enterovirga sp. TaxID=2026350 RepID=UPI00262E4F65|nr:hypothetical protein [Enterovirga sp.]
MLSIPIVLAVGMATLWSAGVFTPSPEAPSPAPGPKPSPAPGPRAAGGTTDEGFPIAEVDKPGPFKAQQIDGNPNTLLFAFGLRSGGETYTYQAAVGFEGTSTTGAGLIKAVKRGQEASTGQLPVTKVTQPDGYVGFTMSGKLTGASIGAPAICVSALAGKSRDKLDVRDGGGGFCAFATTATGLCDGNVKLGCGDLVP